MSDELPMGWACCRLIDANMVIAGQSPESKYYNENGDGLPFFQGKTDFGQLYPTNRVYCTAPKKVAEIGDILLSVRAPVGPTNLAKETIAIGRGLNAIRPLGGILTRYVLYYFRQIEPVFSGQGTGTTFSAVTVDDIKNLIFPLPPLAEQHRIVAKIDALFSNLDKGVEMLQTIRQQLRTYRQAVLKWAFEGCELVELGRLAEAIDPHPSHRTPPEFKGGMPYIGIRECDYSTRKVNFKIARKVSPDVLIEHVNRYTLRDGDFIIGKIGTIGKPFLIPPEQNYTLSANIVLIQPNFEKTSKNYLYYAFQTQGVDIQLRKTNSTTQAAFGIQRMRTLMIPLTSDDKSKQTAIVAAIESRLSVCDKLEAIIDESLAKAEALRQSILKKAFA